MKKLIFILILFLLPSCSVIEMTTRFGGFMKYVKKLQKEVKKAAKICNKECRTNEKLSDEWCNCMQLCLNDEDIRLLFERYKGKNARVRNGVIALTIKEDGLFSLTVEECQSELKEPKEPQEPKEGVMPTVPDVKIPVQPTPPETEEDE